MADVTITVGSGAALAITGYAPAISATVAPDQLGQIPTIINVQQLQLQLNTILAQIVGALPGYGAALPSVDGQVEGRLFVVTPANTLNQLQNGAWVAL